MSQYLFDKNILHQIDKSVYNFNSEGILFPEVGPNLILRPLSADDYDKGTMYFVHFFIIRLGLFRELLVQFF